MTPVTPPVVGRIARVTDPEAIRAWKLERDRISAIAFAPKSHLTLSQWSDAHRYLSSDTGNAGQWRTDKVPYLRRPMDAITDDAVRRVTVMKAARIGATQGLVINTIFFCVDQDPCAIIAGLPTKDDAYKFSSKLLQPAIDDTPIIANRIVAERNRKRRSTMLEKTYPNGSVQIIGIKSPRTMRMVHGRYILKSEVDAWPGSSGDDGDPYVVIDKRAGSFDLPKFIEESTPLIRETSRIEPAFEAGSREYYYVPCPHCKEYQRLVWGGADVHYGIKWDRRNDGTPNLEKVYYVCEHTGCVIEEVHKSSIVRQGDWKATYPERREHLSFHLNALVSPFQGARWSTLVDEWYKTARKPEKVRVFVNTVLGETYVEEGEQADGDTLTQRRDAGVWWSAEVPVPAGAAVLTRSVDTQGDRLETSVWAWGEGEECWLVDWEMLPGDPATSEPWDALDERVGYKMVSGRLTSIEPKKYKHAGGQELIPRVTMIDGGGHHSKQVKTYCRRRRAKKIWAIFGATQERAPILGSPTRTGRFIQYAVGSFAGKEALIKRIDKIDEPGPGYIHLPLAPWMTDELIAQLTAEKLVVRGDKRKFVKTRARNELTDLWVYALAGLWKLGAGVMNNLASIAAGLMPAEPVKPTEPTPPKDDDEGDAPAAAPEPEPEPPPRPRRRGWMSGYR